MGKGISKEGIMFANAGRRSQEAGLRGLLRTQAKPIPPPQPTSNQLFIIGHDAWAACTIAEIKATCAALREAGLYALPFPKVDIEVLADDAINWTGHDSEALKGLRAVRQHDGSTTYQSSFGPSVVMRLEGLSTVPDSDYRMVIYDRRPGGPVGVHNVTDEMEKSGKKDEQRERHADILIALLATRNAVKATRQNKLAKLGIGKKGKHGGYEYVTTISTPKVEEMPNDDEHPPTEGRTVCPHLRRAHLRNVSYGPGRQFRRAKLIEAVFVNADREWTKTRVGYNVSF